MDDDTEIKQENRCLADGDGHGGRSGGGAGEGG